MRRFLRALERAFDVGLIGFLGLGWLAAAVVLFIAAPWWAGLIELAAGVPFLLGCYSAATS